MFMIRVLLVDHSAEFLKAATHFLSADQKVEVVGQASSFPEAMQQASDLQPDVVVTDLGLAGGDGDDGLGILKALPKAPRVVVLALHDQPEYRAYADSLGADGFVNKSEFGEQLLPLIHTWFDS
jgi:DNA-binding NarL/FixJ family response regulator